MIHKKQLIFLFTIFLSACTGTYSTKIDKSLAQTLHGKSLVITSSRIPKFGVTTSFVFNGDPIDNGNKLIRKYNLTDPAVAIVNSVSNKLSNTFSMKTMPPTRYEEYDPIEFLANKYSKNDYVLDIRTSNWSMGFNLAKKGQYRVFYSSTLFLIDTKTGEVVAENLCTINTPESKTHTYKQYIKNNAFILKQELDSITHHCIGEFEKQFLNN